MITSPLPPAFNCTHQAASRILHTVCDPPIQKDTDNLEHIQQRAIKMIRSRSLCPLRTGWRTWACSVWRRDGCRGTLQQPLIPTEWLSKRDRQVLHGEAWWEDEMMGINWNKRSSDWIWGKIFSHSSSGTGCPETLYHLHPWRFSRPQWIKPWATWSELIAYPALSRGLDYSPPELPSRLSESVILSLWLHSDWL